MRSTRAKRHKPSVEVENQKSPIVAAKRTRSTRTGNCSSTRQYLQNITNPKDLKAPKAGKYPRKIRSAGKMGSSNNNNEVMSPAPKPIVTVPTADQSVALTTAAASTHKRKSVDHSELNNEEVGSATEDVISETKKIKESAEELMQEQLANSIADILGPAEEYEQAIEIGQSMEVQLSEDVEQAIEIGQSMEVQLSGDVEQAVEQPMETSQSLQPNIDTSQSIEQPMETSQTFEAAQQTETSPAKHQNLSSDQLQRSYIVDDGEKPSTSRAALAALAAAAAEKVTDAVAIVDNVVVNATDNIETASTIAPSVVSTSGRVSLRKKRKSVSTSADGNERPSPDAKMNGVTTEDKAKKHSMPLPEKLLLVISNLYLSAAERLKLDFPPRCAADLEHCHQHHYRAPLPEPPNHTQANNLRNSLQQQRYVSFVNWTYDMCHRGEFPGEGVFTKIIELVLSFNARSFNNDSLGYFFNKSIELFSFIVRKYPPCWLTMRKFYTNFFQNPLDATKIFKKDQQPFKSNSILEILLELLESTLQQCTTEDLQADDDSFNTHTPTLKSVPDAETIADPNISPVPAASPPKVADASQNSEYMNIWEWEVHENNLQTFEALRSPSTRLERIFISLRLLLQILESDFVMWILHHHNKAKDWIFCEENRPLVVMVFALSKYTRATDVVKHLFSIFAISVNKGAKREHLQVLERFISLVMVASNTADLEHSAIGVRFPNLGAETKTLIHDFFKIFKSHNTAQVSSYLNTIDMLRIPYVRYEFIDYFLQLFYFAHNEPISPKKIATDLFKRRWLKYKPQVELPPNSDEDLSREQYLQLLLLALEAYCELHGTRAFFQLLTKEKSISSFRSVTDSPHRWPTKGSGSIMLNRICEDLKVLEKQLRMTVRMSRPKVSLPLVDICIDENVVLKYRTDLKYVMIINEILAEYTKDKLEAEEAGDSAKPIPDVDFTAWRTFLSAYVAEDEQ